MILDVEFSLYLISALRHKINLEVVRVWRKIIPMLSKLVMSGKICIYLERENGKQINLIICIKHTGL
jgi:hypothetical protein